jgi:hypothetical protein
MPLRLPLSILALGISAAAMATQIVLLPTQVYSVSGNGRYVACFPFRMDVTTGARHFFSAPGPFFGVPHHFTEDGKSVVAEVIVGENGESQIFRVNDNGTYVALSNDGGSNASPNGVSGNGDYVIGDILGGPGPYQHYRWYNNGIPLSYADYIGVISGDGQTMFGESWGTVVYWYQNNEFPMGDAGWDSPRVTDCSYNGQVAVGYYGQKGFFWLKNTGAFADLGNLPGTPGSVIPTSMHSETGLFVAGVETRDGVSLPFIYKHGTGMMSLAAFLNQRGVPTTDWVFQGVVVSNNGQALIGSGLYKGQPKSFHLWISGNHLTVHSPDSTTTAGKTITGTVSFSEPNAVPRLVYLTTSSPDLVVPNSVSVPAGAENMTFPIHVKPTAAAGKLTVTADHGGGALTASFDVNVVEPIQSVVLSPTRIHGGKYSRCTVSFQKPLRSVTQFVPQQVNGITMPAAINAPAGATSISFNVISPGIQVESLQTYSIKVSSPYHLERSATLQVFPPIGWMTVYPLQIKGGATGLGRIGTTLAAPVGGLRYSLRSLSSLLSVPSQVSIPEGGTQCQFDVTTLPVTASAVRQIEARTALTVKTVNVTLIP